MREAMEEKIEDELQSRMKNYSKVGQVTDRKFERRESVEINNNSMVQEEIARGVVRRGSILNNNMIIPEEGGMPSTLPRARKGSILLDELEKINFTKNRKYSRGDVLKCDECPGLMDKLGKRGDMSRRHSVF